MLIWQWKHFWTYVKAHFFKWWYLFSEKLCNTEYVNIAIQTIMHIVQSCRSVTCGPFGAPPKTHVFLTDEDAPKSVATCCICCASSLVGARISVIGPSPFARGGWLLMCTIAGKMYCRPMLQVSIQVTSCVSRWLTDWLANKQNQLTNWVSG